MKIQSCIRFSTDWKRGKVSDLIGIVKVLRHPSVNVIEGLEELDERVRKHLEALCGTAYGS